MQSTVAIIMCFVVSIHYKTHFVSSDFTDSVLLKVNRTKVMMLDFTSSPSYIKCYIFIVPHLLMYHI